MIPAIVADEMRATLLDYLEAGDSLHDFLEDFPSVTREQAVAALQTGREAYAEHNEE